MQRLRTKTTVAKRKNWRMSHRPAPTPIGIQSVEGWLKYAKYSHKLHPAVNRAATRGPNSTAANRYHGRDRIAFSNSFFGFTVQHCAPDGRKGQ